MPTPTQAKLYDELLTTYGRTIADAFAAAIDDLKSAAEVQRVITALSAGDVDAAIAALHLDPAALGTLQDALQQAYGAGGQLSVSSLPAIKDATGLAVVIRFNARNPRAEAWLRDHSAQLVTRIIEDQRTAIRSALVGGMSRGENPRTTALDIVGRLNRATGKREGGIIGLTAQQEQFVATAREELASDDPKLLANYLTRGRRSKQFDRTVNRIIRDGGKVPADTARKAVEAYERRLLALRGETIGRTEALASLNAAAQEGLLQAVDTGAVSPGQVRRVWRSAGDARVRDTHAGLNGDSVGLTEPFASPSGAKMMFPGDTSLGAGPEEIINCRCLAQARIDFLANIA